MTIQNRTIQILEKYLRDYISESIVCFKKMKNMYDGLINICKLIFLFVKLLIFFKI